MADELPSYEDLTRYKTPGMQRRERLAQYEGTRRRSRRIDSPFYTDVLPSVGVSAVSSFFSGLAGDAKTLDYVFDADITKDTEESLRNISEWIDEMAPTGTVESREKKFIKDDGSLGEAWGDIYAYADLAGQGIGSIGALVLGGGIMKILAKGGIKLMVGKAIQKKADDIMRDGSGELTREAAVKQAKDQITDYATKYDSAIGTGAYTTAEMAIVSGSVGHSIEQEVMRAPPEVLNQSPRFRELYYELKDRGDVTHDQAHNLARIQLSREAGIQGAKDVAIPTAMLGVVPAKYIDKAISGKLTKSTLANFGILAAAEVPTEAGQGAMEQYTQNKVYRDMIDKTRNVLEGVPDAAVREGLGAAFGVAPLAGIRAKAEASIARGDDPDFDALSDQEQITMVDQAGKIDEDAAEAVANDPQMDGKQKFAALQSIIAGSVTGIQTGEPDAAEVVEETPAEVPTSDEVVAEAVAETVEEPAPTIPEQVREDRLDARTDWRMTRKPVSEIKPTSQVAVDETLEQPVTTTDLDQRPIKVDQNGNIIDGNRRYAEALKRGDEDIAVLEQASMVGEGRGRIEGIPDAQDVQEAADEAATSPNNDLPAPTEEQIEADNYKKGHLNYDGLDIAIENPAGSKRRPEWPALVHHYGDIKRTDAADGDSLDVFINKDNESTDTPVFIINQTDEAGNFDEHKVMLGFNTEAEARQGYLDNYTEDWTAPEFIPEMTMGEFKDWLETGDMTQPFDPGPMKVKNGRLYYNGQKISKYEALAMIDDATPATTYINKNDRDYTVREVASFYNAIAARDDVRLALTMPSPQVTHAVDVAVMLNKLPPRLRRLTATVETEADLPTRVIKKIRNRGLEGQVRGAFYRNRVYIVATNHPSPHAAVRTFLHEAIGHYGLRKTLGKGVEPFLEAVARAYPRDIRAIAKKYKLNPFTKSGRLEAAEEYVAQMAEGELKPTLMERLVKLVSDFLANLGIAMPMTTADIKETLTKAQKAVENDGFDVEETVLDESIRFAIKSNTVQPGQATANDTALQAFKDGQPVDMVFRAIWGLGEATQIPRAVRASSAATLRGAVNFYDKYLPWLHPAVDKMARGLIDRYGLDEEYKKLQVEALSRKNMIINEVRDIIDLLEGQGVTAEDSTKIYEILTNEAPREEAWDAVTEPVRKRIEELGQQAVDLGLVSQEAYDRNKGAYLHRVYRKYEENRTGFQKWADNISARKRKISGQETMERGNSIFVKADRIRSDVRVDEFIEDGEGITIYKIDKLSENGQKVIKTTFAREAPESVEEGVKVQEFKVRAVAKGKVKLWRDWTKEEREDMGEITDARYVLGKTFALLAHDLATGEFFQSVSENPEWTWQEEGAPPQDVQDGDKYDHRFGKYSVVDGSEWVKVPKTKVPKSRAYKYGALAGKYVKSEVFQDINATIQAQNVTWWKDILTSFKLNKTARNPVVHFNNIMSNIVLMDMADVRFSDLGHAIAEIARNGDLYREAATYGAMGVSFAEQELQQDVMQKLLDEMVDATGGKAVTIEEKIASLDKLPFNKQVAFMTKIIDKLWNGFDVKGRRVGLRAFDNMMLDFYRHEDEIFRLATYIRRRQQGMSEIEAGIQARDQFLNYDIQAPWINALRASVMPFLSYTYRAIPIVAKSLAQRPWKLAKYFTIAYGMNAIGYALSGGDEERERKSLRPDVSGKLWIGSDRLIRMPWNDEANNPYFWDVRRLVPVGDVFDMNQHHAALPIVPASLMPSGPIAMGFEFMLNKTSFFGEEIVDPLADDPATAAEKTLDWVWKSFGPSAPWIPASYYWDKLGVATSGGRDRLGREYSILEAAGSSVGIKIARHDVEYAMYQKALEIDRTVNAIRMRLSYVEKDFRQGKMKKARYETLKARYIRSLRRLEEKARELVR